MNFLNVLLMMPSQGQGGGDSSATIVMILALFAVMYFFMIRPQQKKAKQLKNFRESLKKGDKVVTIGGIHGKVTEIADTTITIETEGQCRLKLNKDAVNATGEPTAMTQQQK